MVVKHDGQVHFREFFHAELGTLLKVVGRWIERHPQLRIHGVELYGDDAYEDNVRSATVFYTERQS